MAGARLTAEARDFSIFQSIQTDFGAHRASYPIPTEGSFPEVYSDQGLKLTTHLTLVQRSRMLELNLHPHICLQGMVFD
jgi:hypothetical protein